MNNKYLVLKLPIETAKELLDDLPDFLSRIFVADMCLDRGGQVQDAK